MCAQPLSHSLIHQIKITTLFPKARAKPAAAIQSQGRPIWTVAFQGWQAFYPYASFLFPSSSEVEAVFDLVLMFLLSSACNHLLLTKKKDSPSFLRTILLFWYN
jgi:hypothetical protein